MPIYATPGGAFRNVGTIAEEVVLDAAGFVFTNTDSGRVIGPVRFARGKATLINELGGVIRASDLSDEWTQIVIAGSAGDDTVVNAGRIGGRIALGAGNDSMTDRDGVVASQTQGAIDLGSGNDLYRVEGSTFRFLNAEGGEGRDRVVVANTNYQIDGSRLTGFEDLSFEEGGNVQGFSGYRTITLGGSDHFNFLDSFNPVVDLSLAGHSVALTRGSLRSVTGSAGSDTFEVGGGAQVAGNVLLGAGDDYFSVSGLFGGSSPVIGGRVEGGAGTDTIALYLFFDTDRSYDFARVTGFERLSANSGQSAPVTMRVANLSEVTDIQLGSQSTLILSASTLPTANVWGNFGGSLSIAADSQIGRLGSPLGSPFNQDPNLPQSDDRLSISLVNQGRIMQGVAFYIGDDLYDGRTGSVGDTVYGNGGNDRLLGGRGAERFEGGFGADTLAGGLGADTLVGGGGTDLFVGTQAEFAGDTIVDLTLGERILVSDAGAGFTVNQVGTRLTFSTGESLSILTGGDIRVDLRGASGGGLDVYAARRVAEHDFDGDGRSDVLWRDAGGFTTIWVSTGTGFNGATGVGETVSADWKIAGTGDHNGDGVSDILWRNDNGRITDWFGTGRGFNGVTGVDYQAGVDWRVADTGDVDGDGRDDIVWRNDNGRLTVWLASDAGFDGASGIDFQVSADWKVAGAGDFDADGKDDLLWRHDNGAITTWTSTGRGYTASAVTLPVGADWQVAGVADFNGDGRDDILWRNNDGRLTDWFATEGGFVPNAAFSLAVPTAWAVEAAGDYSGDGLADILWRNTDGTLAMWTGTGAGFTPADAATNPVGQEWGVFV